MSTIISIYMLICFPRVSLYQRHWMTRVVTLVPPRDVTLVSRSVCMEDPSRCTEQHESAVKAELRFGRRTNAANSRVSDRMQMHK